MWPWIIVGVVALALIGINLIFVKIQLKYDLVFSREEKRLNLVLVPVFQRFTWEKEIVAPGSPNEWINLIFAMIDKKSNKAPKSQQKQVGKLRGLSSVRSKITFSQYYKIFRLFMSHLVLERFHWKTRLGLDDAMHTALACGGLWAVKGNLTALVSHFSPLEQVELGVEPVYNQAGFSSRLDSIFKIRIVYIMLIICYAGFIMIRGYWNGFTARKTEPSH